MARKFTRKLRQHTRKNTEKSRVTKERLAKGLKCHTKGKEGCPYLHEGHSELVDGGLSGRAGVEMRLYCYER